MFLSHEHAQIIKTKEASIKDKHSGKAFSNSVVGKNVTRTIIFGDSQHLL